MSAGHFPMVAVARPVMQEADCWKDDLSIPMDKVPLFTLLLPLSGLLLVYLGLLAYSVLASSPSSLLDGLRLGRSEEDVERLAEADRQADERNEGHVQGSRLDLLKVLPVDVAALAGFLQRPVGRMAQRADPSAQRPLLLPETSGGSVGLGRSLGFGGGHALRPSGFLLVRDTSHVTRNALTSLVTSKNIERWAFVRTEEAMAKQARWGMAAMSLFGVFQPRGMRSSRTSDGACAGRTSARHQGRTTCCSFGAGVTASESGRREDNGPQDLALPRRGRGSP